MANKIHRNRKKYQKKKNGKVHTTLKGVFCSNEV